MLIDLVYVLFGEMLIRFFAHFLVGLFGFFDVEFYKFITNFVYKPIIRHISQYSLSLGGLPFYFVDGFFCFEKLFILM